jgi:hypothetical protein
MGMIYYAMVNKRGNVRHQASSREKLLDILETSYWSWRSVQSREIPEGKKTYAVYMEKEWAGYSQSKVKVEPLS